LEQNREQKHEELRQEAEHLTGGPGVVATKSQARGGLTGAAIGAIVGFLVGLGLGAILFEGGRGLWITGAALAVAGAVFGGVVGGITGPSRNLKGSEADR
jgi:hypothetical protein